MRYLARHYGEPKLIAFFDQVVRRQSTVEAAARAVFGADWPTIAAAAAQAIRSEAAQQ
ncbi:hypothetical protein [Dactylosporangium salmoneum]|uniref:Uncharacterized protein n=1 Tax=Dactylosporangium salmoneum TaxID=53361 RepID=A0ABN3GY64_9ACTN